MDSNVTILEQELEGAVDIKDKKSLHRYITLLAESFIRKEDHVTEWGAFRSDIQILAESMKQSFERADERFASILSVMKARFESADRRFEDMQRQIDLRFEQANKRFEAIDKRFESVDKHFEETIRYMDRRFEHVNKRFTMMLSFITVGFVIMSTLITVYQFLG